MTFDQTNLLRRLEPAVRPGTAPSPSRSAAPSPSGRFDHALLLVSGGRPTGRAPVTVGVGAALERELDRDQLARLGTAADEAHAAGAERAVMLVDGRAVIVEVAERSIAAELTEGSALARFDVDAALLVPDAGGDRAEKVLGTPAPGVIPMAVARQLVAHAAGTH